VQQESPGLQRAARTLEREALRRVEAVHDWVSVLLAKTSAHEGSWGSVQRNLDGQGASVGVLQWTQRGGGLGLLLAAMQRADPAAFASIFGAAWPELLEVTARRSLEPVAGAYLWDEPWLGRFLRAGGHLPFRSVQVQLASKGEYMRAAAAIAGLLGVSTERAMTMYFNRAVHQGAGGALACARSLVEHWTLNPGSRPTDARAILAQYAWTCASRFRRTVPPASDRYGTAGTIRWVQLPPGAPEVDLDAAGELVRRVPIAPTWHAVTGAWDLWDLIIRRSASILDDPVLRDTAVDLSAIA
jgi:hypothetical protein